MYESQYVDTDELEMVNAVVAVESKSKYESLYLDIVTCFCFAELPIIQLISTFYQVD